MDYENFLMEAFEEYQAEMDSRDNADYMVNRPQLQKLAGAYQFFVEYANDNGGKVDPVEFIPKNEHCGVTAYYTLFAPFGEELEKFKQVIQDASAISIDSLVNGDICISINIPNVFMQK